MCHLTAIWLLPRHHQYGDWPSSGEIDIVESRGNNDLTDEFGNQMGNSHAGQTLHWGPYFEQNQYQRTNGGTNDDFGDNFHMYQLEWTPEFIS